MLEIAVQGKRGSSSPSRRAFLRTSLAACGGVSLPLLRFARAGTPAVQPRNDSAVIQIWLGGGPSQNDTYDLKPTAPEQVRGPYLPISTNVAGIQICELLPRQATIMNRLSLVRSLYHTTNQHVEGIHWTQTGRYTRLIENSNPAHLPYPAIGSITAWARGPNRPGIAPYVHIAPTPKELPLFIRVHGAAHLGQQYAPLWVESVRTTNQDDLSSIATANFRLPLLDLRPDLDVPRLDHRDALLHALEQAPETGPSAGPDGWAQSRQQAMQLLSSNAARAAFDLSREDPRLRDRYGRNAWGQGALLCRRLVEAGVTFVTLNTDTYSALWDSHNNLKQSFDQMLPLYDQFLTALIEDLELRGLYERVMLIVWGEFGRTPRMGQPSPDGAGANATGRDHWGRSAFALLGGGGLRGGVVVGSTTRDGGDPQDRPITPADILATLYQRLGIDPRQELTDRLGRPYVLLDGGEPIRELL